ncbi:MAG TPA: hypothetical protein PLB35_09600, partial [Myxococcota bacterium]|nr:hypothetical protein [Myxococcota bacterium]
MSKLPPRLTRFEPQGRKTTDIETQNAKESISAVPGKHAAPEHKTVAMSDVTKNALRGGNDGCHFIVHRIGGRQKISAHLAKKPGSGTVIQPNGS